MNKGNGMGLARIADRMRYMGQMGRPFAFGVSEFMMPWIRYERWEANVECMAGSSRFGIYFLTTHIFLLRVFSRTREAVCKISSGNLFSPGNNTVYTYACAL